MQIPIIPFRGRKRPFGSIPRINWGHPLAQSIQFYAYDIGGVIIDLVNGDVGTRTASTTAFTIAQSQFGSGIKYGGTATSDLITLARAKKSSTFTNTAPFSAAMACFGSAGALNNYSCATGDTTTDVFGFTIQSGPVWGTNFNNGGNQVGWTGSFVANAYQSAVIVATSGTTCTRYLNGKLDGTNTAITTTNATNDQQVVLNSGTAGAANFGGGVAGIIYYFAGWNRILTQQEAFQLHVDPYCFLIYPEDEMFATLVGAANVDTFYAGAWHRPLDFIYRKVNIIGAS